MADKVEKIERGDIIRIEYDLWIKDDDILFETTHRELAEEQGITDENAVYEPIPLIVDEGKAVKGLYDSILAAEVGKEYDIEVPPEEGLGNRDPKLVEWHMMNEIRRQKLEPVVGEKITIKDKSGKERTGIVTMVSPRRVRVDYNNPLAGKTLKYKYKIEERASNPENKVATILEIGFGRKEDFEITADKESVEIKLPEVCKYDQFWLIAKFKGKGNAFGLGNEPAFGTAITGGVIGFDGGTPSTGMTVLIVIVVLGLYVLIHRQKRRK